MVGKKANVLRQFHLLIARDDDGFSWQVRYGRNSIPAERSLRSYLTRGEAAQEGELALARHRDQGDASSEATSPG